MTKPNPKPGIGQKKCLQRQAGGTLSPQWESEIPPHSGEPWHVVAPALSWEASDASPCAWVFPCGMKGIELSRWLHRY